MKILLAVLMCFILTASECLAIKGGPVYPASKNVVGTYAGVLQPDFDPTNPLASNSIGIFSLSVPSVGTGTGSFVMFSQGRAFTGTITGTGDPKNGQIKGLLSARYNYSIQRVSNDSTGTPVVVSVPITATVDGPLDAKVVAPKQGVFSSAITATRLKGSATAYITGGFVNGSTGEPVIDSILTLTVSGFKQSATAVTASS